MESQEQTSEGYKETLVYLDFNDKIPPELLKDKVFIRIASLEDKNPLIQVNDMIFKGTYDYSLGTNLFFRKISNQVPSEFPFQAPTNFELQFLDTQTKVLNCKQMRIPPTVEALPDNQESIKYNFKWDYQELLEKFENHTLDLKDMILQPDELPEPTSPEKVSVTRKKESAPNVEPDTCEDMDMTENNEDAVQIINIDIPEEPYQELKMAYENLQMLARKPLKRQIIPEDVECDPEYKSSYDYKSIECKVLEPPFFSYVRSPESLEKNTLSNYVDINRCVRLGIIPPSNDFPRILTDDEKEMVFTVENFENLSLTARYSVLISLMEELEKQMNSSTPEENLKKDEFGHTPLETLDIFKKLVSSLKHQIVVQKENIN